MLIVRLLFGCGKYYPDGLLVLHQIGFEGHRATQSVKGKAWGTGNGYSLVMTHNAVSDILDCSLRASHEAVICAVAPFEKGKPFLSRRAWRLTT
jgi:hypothetical protein